MAPIKTRLITRIAGAVFIALCPMLLKAQQQDDEAFKKKLADFRYSFYTLTTEVAQLDSSVMPRIKAFVEQNKAAISRHKKLALDSHLVDTINLTGYVKDTTIDMEDSFKYLSQQSAGYPFEGMMDYFTIDPDQLFYSIVQGNYVMYLRMNKFQNAGVAMLGFYLGLTRPLEKVMKQSDNQYRIAFDFYDKVYMTDFNAGTNVYSNIIVYKRTNR